MDGGATPSSSPVPAVVTVGPRRLVGWLLAVWDLIVGDELGVSRTCGRILENPPGDAVVLAEKLWVHGEVLARLVGVAALALAVAVIWVPALAPGLHETSQMMNMAGS